MYDPKWVGNTWFDSLILTILFKKFFEAFLQETHYVFYYDQDIVTLLHFYQTHFIYPQNSHLFW